MARSRIEVKFLGGIQSIEFNICWGEQLTCEDITWQCLKHVQPRICTGNADGNLSLSQYLPAFGLLDTGETNSWYPLFYNFDGTVESITCKFRVRFRPHVRLYEENNIVWEYFVLQARDDFLLGDVGTVAFTDRSGEAEVNRNVLLRLCKSALMIPEKFPLIGSQVARPPNNMRIYNYNKKFSKELFSRINSAKHCCNRFIDYFLLHSMLQDDFLLESSKNFHLTDYKRVFVHRFLEIFPQYCFEIFDCQSTDSNCKVSLFMRVYSEGPSSLSTGLYYGKYMLKCRLNEIADLKLIPPTSTDPHLQQWKVAIDLKRVQTQESTLQLTFSKREEADDLISMLQGYLCLCLSIDYYFSDFVPPSTSARQRLESFGPLSHDKAKQYLENSNNTNTEFEKPPEEHYKYLLYQDKEKYNHFNIATCATDCDYWVEWNYDRKLVETVELKTSTNDKELFKENSALTFKSRLNKKFGLQLHCVKDGNRMNEDSIFAIGESETAMPQLLNNSSSIGHDTLKTFFNQGDFETKLVISVNPGGLGSDRSHLKRLRVERKADGVQFMLLQPNGGHHSKREALFTSVDVHIGIQQLDLNLNKDCVIRFYGLAHSSSNDSSWLFEYAPFGTLNAFLNVKKNKPSTAVKMKMAFQVVDVLNLLEHIFHGNIRGENFFVFLEPGNENVPKIKLGDPGLAKFFDERPHEFDKENDERTPWLAPERRKDLKNETFKTLKAEIYSVGTVIAEIFHRTSDFRALLHCPEPQKLSDHFCGTDLGDRLKPERQNRSENEADAVLEDAWKHVVSCWNENPSDRPSTFQLIIAFSALVKRADKLTCEKMGDFVSTYDQPPEQQLPDPLPHSLEDLKNKIPNQKKIPRDCVSYDEKDKLGAGYFGVVYKGVMKPQGSTRLETVAIKMCGQLSDQSRVDFYKEIAVMVNLTHENIVKFCCISIAGDQVLLILELMPDGNLEKYVKENKLRFVTEPHCMMKELTKVLLGVIKGMAYLAEEGIVHRDLAARNILLAVKKTNSGRQITTKIGDFGLAKVYGNKLYYIESNIGYMPCYVFPPEYLMPLLDRQDIPFDKSGDIWSFGMIVWEAFNPDKSPVKDILECVGPPLNGQDKLKAILDFYRRGERLPKYSYMTDSMYEIVKTACWASKPEDRLKLIPLEEQFQNLLRGGPTPESQRF